MEKNFNESVVEDSLNIRDSLSRYAVRWPIFLISAIIALGCSVVYLKYQKPVYQIKAKVLIKESAGFDDPSAVLFGNRFNRRLSNIPNQTTILTSYPIVFKTIERAELNVNYFKKSTFGNVELYKGAPFKVVFKDSINRGSKALNHNFLVNLESEKSFEINCESLEGFQNGRFLFDTWFNLEGLDVKVLLLKSDFLETEDFQQNEYGFSVRTTEQLARQYKDMIKIEESTFSSVVEIAIRSKNAYRTIDFLNTLLEVYTEENLAAKNSIGDSTVAFIDRELSAITDSLSFRENELENFQSSLKVPNLTMQGEMILREYTELEVEKDEFELKRKYYSYIKENLGKTEAYNDILTPAAFGISDPVLNEMVLNMVNLQIEKSTLIQNGAEKSSRIPTIDRQVKDFERIIAKSIDDLATSNSMVLSELGDKLKKVKQSAKKLPKSEREYVNLKRLLSLNEGIYIFLMEKRANALISKASNTADCRVIEPPLMEPNRPVAPDGRMTKIIGFLLGLFIPLGVMIVFDSLNDKIKSLEEFEGLTSTPLLGSIPHHNRKAEGIAVVEAPKSALSESMRMVRSNLDFFGESLTVGGKTVLITSSISGEGKTFMAINLAGILALSGKKTVLVGLDLRKPRLHEDLSLSNNQGVSTYLSGKCELNQIILSQSVDNLDVILAGPIPPNPAELLLNKKALEMIDTLKKAYDYVILDTAPSNLVTDAQLLMKHSDVNIYVVRRGRSTRNFVKSINSVYRSGKFKNLAVIMNDTKQNKGYGYGYGYYDDTTSDGKFSKLLKKFRKA